MKRKHRRGQRHYSGKELLERRKAERQEHEKRLAEAKKRQEDCFRFPIRHYPFSLLCGFNGILHFE